MNTKFGKKKRRRHERDAEQLRNQSPDVDPQSESKKPVAFRGQYFSAFKSFGLCLAGIVATLIFQIAFVSALPNAGFWIEVRPFPSDNAQCKVYLALIWNDEVIERFNVKLPFPVAIDSYVAGVSEETVIDDKYQHITKIDQDETGKCTIADESKNSYLNLTAAAAGTTLSIQGTAIPRNIFAIAWVVGRAGHKPVDLIHRSTDPTTTTGQYSYLKLGQLVTKDVPITYGAWGDPLPWPRERK